MKAVNLERGQPAGCAGTPPAFWGIVVVDDADLFGGDLEPCGIFLPIIMNRAIAIGCADSFGFVLRLRIRDHISDLFAGMYVDAVVNQFAGGKRGPRFDIVFFDLAAQDLFDDQQTRIDLPAFEFGQASFVDSTRVLPAMMKLFDVSSLRQSQSSISSCASLMNCGVSCRRQARPRIFMPPPVNTP